MGVALKQKMCLLTGVGSDITSAPNETCMGGWETVLKGNNGKHIFQQAAIGCHPPKKTLVMIS